MTDATPVITIRDLWVCFVMAVWKMRGVSRTHDDDDDDDDDESDDDEVVDLQLGAIRNQFLL